MATSQFDIRAIGEDDWALERELRISQLTENCVWSSETLEQALAYPDDEWKMRARRGSASEGVRLVCVDATTGRWLGIMGGYVGALSSGVPCTLLVSVYVRDGYRGSDVGITDALMNAVETWARTQGDQIALTVHEDNARAIRAYTKRGYVDHGVRRSHANDQGVAIEMVKSFTHIVDQT